MSFSSETTSNWGAAHEVGDVSFITAQPGVSGKVITCTSCRQRKSKCDRLQPKCSTCTRLRLECKYPERKRNPGLRRRNMKDLEARLAQLETQLVSEPKKASMITQSLDESSIQADGNFSAMEMNLDLGDMAHMDPSGNMLTSLAGLNTTDHNIPASDAHSQEVIEMGLQERLPSQKMMNDLNEIYFDKFHPTLPMIHRYRYLASMDRAPHARPPVCLRYAMWAIAATLSDEYNRFDDLLYKRARFYADAAEMKGVGETFVSVYHAQTWSLIAMFEAKKTYFSRSWMSVGKAVRLVQMLGLYRVDAEVIEVKEILPPPQDWIEVEERRRTFWAAFYGDRWASSMTGWPMLIAENEILTNLPASEESFTQGRLEKTISLAQALTSEDSGSISLYGGVLVSITLYGQVHQHLHMTGPDEHPEDPLNGEFWKRHRRMDSILSNTFMYLPDHLKLPGGLGDMNIVFTHMNIHASAIGLHQAALATAVKHNITTDVVRHSQFRSQIAAEEITNIMRRINHIDGFHMSSWVGYCLYVAALTFLKDRKSDRPHRRSATEVDFLLTSMRAIGKRHTITKHFAVQLELDMGAARSNRNTNSSSREPIRGTMLTVPVHGNSEERRSFEPIEGGPPVSYDPETADNSLKDILARARSVPGGAPCNAVTPGDTSGISSSEIPIATFDGPISWTADLETAYPSNQNNSGHNLLFENGVANFQQSSPWTFTGNMTAQASRATGSSSMLPSSEPSDWNTMQYPYRTTDLERGRPFDANRLSSDEPTVSESLNQWPALEGFANLENMPQAGVDNLFHLFPQ